MEYKEQPDHHEEHQPRCIIQRPSLLLWADVEKPEHRTDLLNGKSHEKWPLLLTPPLRHFGLETFSIFWDCLYWCSYIYIPIPMRIHFNTNIVVLIQILVWLQSVQATHLSRQGCGGERHRRGACCVPEDSLWFFSLVQLPSLGMTQFTNIAVFRSAGIS